MAGIQDFIDLATKQLGVSKEAATSATGGLASVIREKVGSADFGKLTTHVPGLDALASGGGGGGGGAGGGLGGMLGGLAKKAGGLVGGAGGDAAGGLAAVTGAGIPADKASGFLSLFVNFVKTKVPPDVLKTVLSKVPALGGLVKV